MLYLRREVDSKYNNYVKILFQSIFILSVTGISVNLECYLFLTDLEQARKNI